MLIKLIDIIVYSLIGIAMVLWASFMINAPTIKVKEPNKVTVQIHCCAGYKFLHMPNGNIQQLLNEYGQGIPCEVGT